MTRDNLQFPQTGQFPREVSRLISMVLLGGFVLGHGIGRDGFAQDFRPQPGAQPGYAQPGYVQPGFQQQRPPQPTYTQPVYPQSGVPYPAYRQPSPFQPGAAPNGQFPGRPYQNPAYPNPVYPNQAIPANPYPLVGTPVSARPNFVPISTKDSMYDLAQRHPLCVIVGEQIASQLIATETVEEGPFREMIMGADVQGTQRTNARTSIDFLPNESSMMMKVVLNGHTVNQTLSQVRQAAIQSAGSVEFQVTKQIEFDGWVLRTWTPAAFMTIRQQHLGASTPVSPIPLLGPLTNAIVMSAAEQQKPMTQAVAAQRITQAVAPQFNSRLDDVLSGLNRQLSGEVKDWLTQSQIYPSHVATRSSHNAGMWGVAFETTAPASAGTTPVVPISTQGGRKVKALPSKLLLPVSTSGENKNGLSLPFVAESENIQDRIIALVHESLIADLAERYELGGKDIPPALLGSFLSGPNAEPQGPSLGTLVLDREAPISATITKGEFLLTVRAGFKPVIGPEIPPYEVVFSFRPILTETEVTLKPEMVSMTSLTPGSGGLFGAASEGLIRSAIEQKLQSYNFPRNVNVPREAGKEPLPLRLQSLTLADGWLSIAYEPVAKAQRPVWQSSEGLMEDAVVR
ncbi:MAG TPA: hypothetical protein VNQ76_19280 [Planctomicrobium sp.]|nr:hypothetical protein [Planctomicrobium sp.]